MAEARKPASRKPAKRGPTKAAALKALGLTQEDLDALKELRVPSTQDDPQAGRSVEASAVVRPPANLGDGPAPRDPQGELETRPAPEQKAWDAPDENGEPVWYARNLRGVDVGFRLTRQQAQGEKRTNLKPRGSRGDMVRLQPEDLKDAELKTQVSFDLIEVIPEGQALAAIEKQYTNQQTQVPAHIAMLRNPKGEEYEQANPVQFASDEEAYGIKVADLDPSVMQGKRSDKEIKRDGGFVQNAQQTPTGGNPAIISDGFMAPTQGDSQLGGSDEKSQQVDALARSNQFEGPGAGLGEITVKVEPVQRVR